MPTKSLARPLFTAAAIAVGFATTAMAEPPAFLVLDILPLKEGATLEQAYAYFEAVEPIFERYDFVRSDAPLETLDVVRGGVQTDVVNLWETSNPQAAFEGIFSDEEYLHIHVPTRDAIFDLEDATIVVTQRVQ